MSLPYHDNPRHFCRSFHPDSRMLLAYLPVYPFDAEFCESCERTVVYWKPLKLFIWNVIFGWWWGGRAMVGFDIDFPPERRKNTITIENGPITRTEIRRDK